MAPRTGIDKIAELVDIIMRDNGNTGGLVTYDVPGGPVTGHGLHKTSEVAIQLCFLPAGCEFTKHSHVEDETMVVFRGELKLKSGMDVDVLGPGESITFPAGVAHSATTEIDTCIVAVTVPGGEGYPDAAK